jgi:hypothetical protein
LVAPCSGNAAQAALLPILSSNSPAQSPAPPIARAELSHRVRKIAAYPPLCDMSDLQRREFHEALRDADSFEDLPGVQRFTGPEE